jgi:uncharacterized protein (TIGR03086 family)
MTAGAMTTTLSGGVALLERAMGYTLGSLQLVTPEAMSKATPCSEWDLRALLLHMHESLVTLDDAMAAGHVGLESSGSNDDPTVDPVAALRNRACRMIGTWANARRSGEISIVDRALPPGVVAATGAVEVAVHGWDVSRACGRDRPVPQALAEELLELCPLIVNADDRPTRFAEPVDVSPVAGPGDRLLAFLGRRPA